MFSITVSDANPVLIISYVGYKSQEISVANQTDVNISLTAGSEQLTDVVVVGYGTQKKVTVTGAVSAVKELNWLNHLPLT